MKTIPDIHLEGIPVGLEKNQICYINCILQNLFRFKDLVIEIL